MKTKDYLSRIDIQVMLLMSIFTLFTTGITAAIYWNFSYGVMMNSLESRVQAIYEYIDKALDNETFRQINTTEDINSDLYLENKETLLMLKNACHVMYLYTAKENENGDLIYVIDGLEEHLDFRYPGDLIEEEIEEKMRLALANQYVFPRKILNTDWGDIFIAYMPMHDQNGEVIGVIGLEFDASETYQMYESLQSYTPIIIIISVLFAALVSLRLFKRVSNPLYIGKTNLDSTTGLKDRNSYNVDFNNLMVRKNVNYLGLIVADINGLKEVNDRLGHIAGDDYIKLVSTAIRETKLTSMAAYRTGGDEFVIIMQNARPEEFEIFIRNCSNMVKSQTEFPDMRCSLSCGYAIFDKTLDNDIEDTYHRADTAMYTEKRRQKENKER